MIWNILIVFLKIGAVNIFPAIRDWKHLTVCFVIVRCMAGEVAQAIQSIWNIMEERSKHVHIVLFRTSQKIMIR